MKYYILVDTPAGQLVVAEQDSAISGVYCGKARPDMQLAETALLCEARRQLGEYFAGQRRGFELPLAAQGTEFQQKVWAALRDIPYGETRSYAQIAAAVQSPRAARAVGAACHRNPLLVLTPCHRVLGASGGLVGFAAGLPAKKTLLQLEGWRDVV